MAEGRGGERHPEPVGDDRRLAFVHAGQHGAEFLAADPGQQVAAAQVRPCHAREFGQQPIAGLVPEDVVDGLEFIQIHHDDRAPQLPRDAFLGQALRLDHEAGAVQRAGERVEHGRVGQLILEPLPAHQRQTQVDGHDGKSEEEHRKRHGRGGRGELNGAGVEMEADRARDSRRGRNDVQADQDAARRQALDALGFDAVDDAQREIPGQHQGGQ